MYSIGFAEDNSLALKAKVRIEDLTSEDFQIHDVEAKWIRDTELLYRTADGNLERLNVETMEMTLLMTNRKFKEFQVSRYEVSPDMKYALLAYNVKKTHRHSFTAYYTLCNLDTWEHLSLNPPEVREAELLYAGWGVLGQQLVRICFIYYDTCIDAFY
ncbi:hypothetical protein scyTo_0006520 [Scyliorhinus torazame]|uniref:Dipeptidylpeptidase IV N-terminal domain-containing protein n=1 Tax=Scyliorhinus torazame TaxID=75743 RepID=A0A401PIC4_SCYTO|nr:hypothetical protein [Scyliorhinus torazame]